MKTPAWSGFRKGSSPLLTCLATLLAGMQAGHAAPKPSSADRIVSDFLATYCLECHDADVQKGERDFESFALPLNSLADILSAQEIVDQVTLQDMPPPKADQPSEEERLAVVRALRESIRSMRGQMDRSEARTVMRRLSHREYENTLKVLFGRRIDTLGLTADFPRERTSHHMDNIGASLVTSGFLLDQYFQAADRLVESRLGRPVMDAKTWHFDGHFVQYEELQGPHRAAFDFRYLCLYEQPNSDTRQGGYGHIEDFLEGVPVSGLYRIEVLAQALHRDTHYDPDIFKIDFSEPFLLGVVPGDVTKGHIHYPQPIEPLLGQSVVPDDKPTWLTFQVWLEEGQTPRFIFPNGPYESRASIMAINRRYKDEFKGEVSRVGVSRTHILREGALPHIRISEIKVQGPLAEPGGGKEEQTVFGPGGFQAGQAEAQLLAFARRAYRRPLTREDGKRIRHTYQTRLEEGASPRQSALDTLKLILCSPSFLYLSEVTSEENALLEPFDLAARLSYTLWTSPPDSELLAAATDGSLNDPSVLRQQVVRMLKDDRIAGFVDGFLDSWLNLRELGGMPPPREQAEVYYAENLPASMKKEARLFFSHLLREDGPLTDFLHADYTFLDKKLARLYQVPEREKLRLADGFQRVSLAGNQQRGGLLGMASVLAVSANGVETSPVTRGVWISENILGIAPPPPPDEVPPIDSDVRGATTIRERLAKHSSLKTCAECHRKIDPLGFALESFDPIGRWRTHYPKPKGDAAAPQVDPSGEFSNGVAFSGFPDFKTTLLEHRSEAFARHLLSQALTYATGRHMGAVDRVEIDEILERMQSSGGGLRTLLVEALTSEIFRSR